MSFSWLESLKKKEQYISGWTRCCPGLLNQWDRRWTFHKTEKEAQSLLKIALFVPMIWLPTYILLSGSSHNYILSKICRTSRPPWQCWPLLGSGHSQPAVGSSWHLYQGLKSPARVQFWGLELPKDQSVPARGCWPQLSSHLQTSAKTLLWKGWKVKMRGLWCLGSTDRRQWMHWARTWWLKWRPHWKLWSLTRLAVFSWSGSKLSVLDGSAVIKNWLKDMTSGMAIDHPVTPLGEPECMYCKWCCHVGLTRKELSAREQTWRRGPRWHQMRLVEKMIKMRNCTWILGSVFFLESQDNFDRLDLLLHVAGK